MSVRLIGIVLVIGILGLGFVAWKSAMQPASPPAPTDTGSGSTGMPPEAATEPASGPGLARAGAAGASDAACHLRRAGRLRLRRRRVRGVLLRRRPGRGRGREPGALDR